jgi:hypothetical protein
MWNDLTMSERADVIKMAVKAGLRDMKSIRDFYDNSLKYADGGSIHIAPSKRGTFTAAATKHGMGVQEFASKVLANKDDYSPAMVKKANFAKNASKWKHDLGGYLFGEGGPKVTLVDSDKVRMNNSGIFSDENGNTIGDSVVLPELTVRPTTPQTNSSSYYQQWLMRQADRGGRNMSSSDREAYDRMMSRVANQNEVKNFTGFDGTIYKHGNGALEQVSPKFDALTLGRQFYTDGLFSLISNNSKNTLNRLRYLSTIENGSVSDKLLNDRMLDELTFVNGKRVYKPVKTVEDVVSFTYGLPKGITPKTKLSSLTNEQMYDLAVRDIQRENPGDWFIGIGNSAKNNRYIHMDANSSIIPTTEGFLPTREGFTKVGRYGTPEIWYNKNIPYYPIDLSHTPRTVVTTKKALGIKNTFGNVVHTPRALKYDDILFGLEPNEFGSYNRVLYSPNKKASLSTTIYNTSINPDNIFNIQRKVK